MTPQEAAAQGLSWVPENHPMYGTAGFVGGAAQQVQGPGLQADPATTGATQVQGPGLTAATPSAAQPAPNPADPFAAMGGGTLVNGNWIPNSNPAEIARQQGQAPAAGTPGATPAATGTAGGPTGYSTNADTQNTVVNTYLNQIQRGTAVDPNDPNFRQQADAFSAAQERARRNAQDERGEQAFAAGQRGVGGNLVEQRMIDESAARNTGAFEAELVGRELQNRRSEIQAALQGLSGMISADQQAALQRELAALNAAIEREGIAATSATNANAQRIQEMLGTGALNVDMLRALLQNNQFGDQFGLEYGQAAFDNFMRSAGL